jgi:hypothetical protein
MQHCRTAQVQIYFREPRDVGIFSRSSPLFRQKEIDNERAERLPFKIGI